MSDDLNLSTGDPARGDGANERRRQRRAKRQESQPESSGVPDGIVREQLTRAFNGLAHSREAKGDDELAEAFREEGDAMTEGFVALTDNVKPLRMPVIILLNIVITLLAFGRVGTILLNRLADRRARRQAEREAAMGQVPGEDGVEFQG